MNRNQLPQAANPPGALIPGEARSWAGSASAEPEWVGIAANAASGRGKGRAIVDRLAEALVQRGLVPRVAWNLADRRRLVEDAGADEAMCRCLVAVGGDGTVASLINECPSVPIAVVPAGTENLFARHFGFARDPQRAAERIAAGHGALMDLGVADGRRFALMAGFGFDADVVGRHHAARLGRAGVLRPTHRVAYVEPVLRSSFGYRFPPLSIEAEGTDGAVETLVGTTAFVFNLPRYALGLPFAPTAQADDGWLDLVVFRDPGPLQALRYLWLVFRGLHLQRPGIVHRRVRRLSIQAEAPVPVQLDGDPGGEVNPAAGVPWVVEVLPDAVEVLVARAGVGLASTAG